MSERAQELLDVGVGRGTWNHMTQEAFTRTHSVYQRAAPMQKQTFDGSLQLFSGLKQNKDEDVPLMIGGAVNLNPRP